jgi:cbb3-type cytochrome oxidase subunit 3
MKGLMSELGMNSFTMIALVVSFCAFLAVVVRTLTRPQHEIEAQAKLYEDDDPEEAEGRNRGDG